ncbi:putative truncated acetolactate synthase [Actinoplanes missouriensis 431]|uniref:Putative truncated acetolactate synthase n=1 Tax=Actinoplanes missouriensis (strain ATCC 14538 / DSM 43046 / CBS 188.64 / JCM 3121 / NBRC 102363 / NCIMB 12654 / NRRL B-3342 / UNCC 431) TaxID=512565 RepID=I0H3X8_ACTM4|nr:putative truncated acetolactate synthase [Actinoplanes missouriensis 431]
MGTVADVVGAALVRLGADHVFGVVGSGNFHVTNALVKHGARFVATRHEGGAATAADAYSRLTGRPGVVTVHQGCGLTNAMTGIAEAAKSRTPMIVVAAEPAASARLSNFRVDQEALARAVGAASERVHGPATAVSDTARAWRLAVAERRTVVLNLPIDVQAASAEFTDPPAAPSIEPPRASDAAVTALADLLANAQRPVFIAGRGALHARAELETLAARCGALLATSAVAKGLFAGNDWNLDVSGGFATPLAAELISSADVVVAWGASLNMWTSRHGKLINPAATVVQVDIDQSSLGAHRPVHLGVVSDARLCAVAVTPRSRAPLPVSGPIRYGVSSTPAAAGVTSRSPTTAPPRTSTREHSASPSTTCSRRNAWWPSTRVTSWATRRCSCPFPITEGSVSRRPSSRSVSDSPPRSAPPWPTPAGPRSRRAATAVS